MPGCYFERWNAVSRISSTTRAAWALGTLLGVLCPSAQANEPMLDAAHQVVVAWQIFINDRSTTIGLVSQQQVDPITVVPGWSLFLLAQVEAEQAGFAFITGEEVLIVVDYIFLNPVEIGGDCLKIPVLLP